MSKYTKRQYLADIAANEAAIAAVKAELESYNVRAEAGESVNEMSEAWNAAHDKEWELECERSDIERRWRRRDWTSADYAMRELVAANVD